MSSRRKANATSFKPGVSGNPKGRPKGIQETRPRGYLRTAIDTVMAADRKKLVDAIRHGLEDKRSAYAFVELIGKVGKEIGGNAAEDARPVIFHFHTNLNPLALAGPQASPRRIIAGEPSHGVGAPSLPVQPGGGRRPSTPERPQDVTSEVGDR
jgi:hypothetical protein